MEKHLFLIAFILLNMGCSDDIPGDIYLGGEVKPERLVSKIIETYPGSMSSGNTWTFEYDEQNRISKTLYEWGDHYDISYITYEEDKIVQELHDGWYNDKFSPKPDIKHLYYYLKSDGNTEIMSNYDLDGSNPTDPYSSASVAYMTYDKNGYHTYIDSENYDGENKTVYWKEGDVQRIKYNESGPSVYWGYGKQINNPYTNIDFNYFLDSDEICRFFIAPKCLKAFGFFGKRGKHYKTKESNAIDSNKYTVYEYILDEKGYVVKIIEADEDGDRDCIYEISYIDANK